MANVEIFPNIQILIIQDIKNKTRKSINFKQKQGLKNHKVKSQKITKKILKIEKQGPKRKNLGFAKSNQVYLFAYTVC